MSIVNFQKSSAPSDWGAIGKQSRKVVWAGVLGAMCIVFLGTHKPADAQNSAPGRLQASREVRLVTKELPPFALAGTYYESNAGKESPVVVLLHMQHGNRLVWKGLAQKLQSTGYAVFTVDLRGHGQSKGVTVGKRNLEPDKLRPIDYQNMVLFDMEAVKKFLLQEHQDQKLNINKLGIVAAEISTAVAANFAARDWLKKPHPDGPIGYRTPRGQDVRLLVLLSPTDLPRLTIIKPVNVLRDPRFGITFLIGVGIKDRQDKGQAKKLYEQIIKIASNKDHTYLEEYAGGQRGTNLLGERDSKVRSDILRVLDMHLKSLPPTWRNRQSKLKKKKK